MKALLEPARARPADAALIAGLLDLYGAGGGTQWLAWAQQLQAAMDAQFWDALRGAPPARAPCLRAPPFSRAQGMSSSGPRACRLRPLHAVSQRLGRG